MSWTGSECQRCEQGPCRPPAPVKSRWRVRASSPCRIRKRGGTWFDTVTAHSTTLDEINYVMRGDTVLCRFDHGDYQLEILKRYVDQV
jgi:hypothetical protein